MSKTAREKFMCGDTVTEGSSPEQFIIDQVEREDNPALGADVDMGRYTLFAADGSLRHNIPGYLLRKVRP